MGGYAGAYPASADEYLSKGVVSQELTRAEKPLRLAILPIDEVEVDFAQCGGKAYVEIRYSDEELGTVTPGDVYVDGEEVGDFDWVDDFAKVEVEPGMHEVKVYEFMGDLMGRIRIWARPGDVVKLELTRSGLRLVGRQKLGEGKSTTVVDPDLVYNSLVKAALKSGKFEVLDRKDVERVLEEQEFSRSGVVDPATAGELGKLLGAEAILTAEVKVSEVQGVDQRGFVATVSGRVISVETGKVLYAGRGLGVGPTPELAAEMAAENFFRRVQSSEETHPSPTDQ